MQRGGWCSFTELHDGLLEEFLDGSVGSELDLSLRWDVVNGMSCFESAPCESMLIIGDGTHGGGEGIGDKQLRRTSKFWTPMRWHRTVI